MNLQHMEGETVETTLLVQHLHGELDAVAARRVDQHIAQCASCRSAAMALDARLRGLAEALAAADCDPPNAAEWAGVLAAARTAARRREHASRVRIAAGWIVLLTATAALASAPGRAWVADRWASLTGADATASAPAPPGRAAIAFAPRGAALEIDFASAQTDGTLAVRFTDGELAELAVSGGGNEQIAVDGDGLRIDNVAASTASWVFTVPRAVDHIGVRIAGRTVAEVERGDDVVIALDSGERVRNAPARDEP